MITSKLGVSAQYKIPRGEKSTKNQTLMLKLIRITETEIKIATDYLFMPRNWKTELSEYWWGYEDAGYRDPQMLLMRVRIDRAILEVSPAIPSLGICERDSYTALSETHTELLAGVGR